MANNVKALFKPVIFLVTHPSAQAHCPEQGLWSLSNVIGLTIFPSLSPSHFSHKHPFPALKAVLSLLPLIPYTQFLPTWTVVLLPFSLTLPWKPPRVLHDSAYKSSALRAFLIP